MPNGAIGPRWNMYGLSRPIGNFGLRPPPGTMFPPGGGGGAAGVGPVGVRDTVEVFRSNGVG
jgi:hypothetical protein